MGIVYSTLGDIITAGLQELAVLRPDEVPTPNQMQVGVNRFNLLLDELSIGLANLYVEAKDSFNLQANVNPYIIGPGLATDSPVPLKVDQAFIMIGGTNFPIDVSMTEDEYNEIPQPTQQSQPSRLWYQPGPASGVITFDYFPDQNYPFTMFSFKALAKAEDQNTALAYPDGYESMLVYNWAVRAAPSYGKKPSEITLALAVRLLSNINNLNMARRIEPADFSDLPGRRGGRSGNIYDMGMK
jgi:hypothetical protein